jgi:hypothetical protein
LLTRLERLFLTSEIFIVWVIGSCSRMSPPFA